jgi:hypothetical protein
MASVAPTTAMRTSQRTDAVPMFPVSCDRATTHPFRSVAGQEYHANHASGGDPTNPADISWPARTLNARTQAFRWRVGGTGDARDDFPKRAPVLQPPPCLLAAISVQSTRFLTGTLAGVGARCLGSSFETAWRGTCRCARTAARLEPRQLRENKKHGGPLSRFWKRRQMRGGRLRRIGPIGFYLTGRNILDRGRGRTVARLRGRHVARRCREELVGRNLDGFVSLPPTSFCRWSEIYQH